MLLESSRHTAADLAWWKTREMADKLNGERIAKSQRAERAIDLMESFASRGKCYVSTCFGKDSTVVSHLAALAGLRIPFVHIVQQGPQYDPDIPRVRDAFLARFPVDYREVVVEPQTKIQEDGKHAPGLDLGIHRAKKQFGGRWIGGMRAAEASIREFTMRTKGLACRTSCSPIGWWTADDVFAWLAHHDLPVHPAYGMTDGGRWDRAQIRVSIIGGVKGRHMGRELWEKQYYSDRLLEIEHANRPV